MNDNLLAQLRKAAHRLDYVPEGTQRVLLPEQVQRGLEIAIVTTIAHYVVFDSCNPDQQALITRAVEDAFLRGVKTC